jgi:hypothetical protein
MKPIRGVKYKKSNNVKSVTKEAGIVERLVAESEFQAIIKEG